MYFITTKRMLEVCFSAHPNIQYRTILYCINVYYLLCLLLSAEYLLPNWIIDPIRQMITAYDFRMDEVGPFTFADRVKMCVFKDYSVGFKAPD